MKMALNPSICIHIINQNSQTFRIMSKKTIRVLVIVEADAWYEMQFSNPQDINTDTLIK